MIMEASRISLAIKSIVLIYILKLTLTNDPSFFCDLLLFSFILFSVIKEKQLNSIFFGLSFQYPAVAMSEVDILKILARQMSSFIS